MQIKILSKPIEKIDEDETKCKYCIFCRTLCQNFGSYCSLIIDCPIEKGFTEIEFKTEEALGK
jgi:hypothetical protein